jgi:hypothetical protein
MKRNYKYRPRNAKKESPEETEMKENLRAISVDLRTYSKEYLGY